MNSQSRSVLAIANADVVNAAGDTDSETINAQGFLPFGDDAFAGAVSSNGVDLSQVTSTADQFSSIGNRTVTASGNTHVSTNVNSGPSQGTANGSGISNFSYTFTINAPTDFAVLGGVDRFGPVSDAGIELHDSSANTVFAIGESSGYAATSIDQSGILPAGTYTLIAFADTEHTYLGPMQPATAGAEFAFIFILDVAAIGEVTNGGFVGIEGSVIPGWEVNGLGTAELVNVDTNSLVLMETGSPVTIGQDIETPGQLFRLQFEFEFLHTEGELQVFLNSELLGTLPAPQALIGELQSHVFQVGSESLFGLMDAPLLFVFDGPAAGLQLRLDNVSIETLALDGCEENLLVEVINGDLRVRGQSNAEQCILISAGEVPGQFHFSGLRGESDGTTFNGQPSLTIDGVVDDVIIDLGSGRKFLILSEGEQTHFDVPGDLKIKNTGNEAATIILDNVQVNGKTSVATKNGDDAIVATGCIFDRSGTIKSGKGDDVVVLGLLGAGIQCSSNWQIQTGNGSDFLNLTQSVIAGTMNIKLGSQDDIAAIGDSILGLTKINGNSGIDEVGDENNVVASFSLQGVEVESDEIVPLQNESLFQPNLMEAALIFEFLDLAD
jgi:hypothetical protein